MSKQREALELARAATPHDQLITELLDSRIPKTEREHAAAREIKKLREALAEPEKTNQCGETCERAKLCSICASGVSNNEPLTEDTRCYETYCSGISFYSPAKYDSNYQLVRETIDFKTGRGINVQDGETDFCTLEYK